MLLLTAAAPVADDAARLSETAVAETDAGQYAAAIRHATQAASLYASSGNVRGRSLALNRAGLASLYAGDYATAERMIRTAIGLSTAAGDDPAWAEQLTNLGNVCFFVGRYSDAASNYDAALRVVAAHSGEPWTARRRRLILINKATLDQKLGRDEAALAIYRDVRAAGTDLRPREQAQILMNVGVLYRHLGDPIKALASYAEARRLFAREHHADGELGVMKNQGIVLALDLERLAEARANFSEALDRATKVGNRREMLQARLYRGETELRLGLAQPARDDFAASLEAARSLATPEEEWKALFGLARSESLVGDHDSARRHLTQAVSTIESIREAIRVPFLKSDFFNDKREVYDALIGVEMQRRDAARIFELIERSHSRAWRERLALNAPVTLAAVQQKLPAGVLLLDTWSSAYGSAMVSVTRDRAEVRPVNSDPKVIQGLSDALSSGEASWRNSAAAMAGWIGALPPRTRHVIIIPDGPLALVPFEVLPAGSRMLVEEAAVSYVPTAAILFRPQAADRGVAPPWQTEMRVFADPIFGSASLDNAAAVRLRLTSSAQEAKDIAAQFGGRSLLHLGSDNRKAYLQNERSPAPILHLATHAVADVNAMEQSRILFSPARSSATGADYLFLKEAYDLPLKGVELAVLSACDTERGRMLRGEGVQSFSRAFLAAGARSTVTTLWRVPDRPTAAFMKVFYYHLQRGSSRAEALRQAKLRFISSGSDLSHPHYWAAFVLSGEGEQPVPRAMRWSSVWIAAALVVMAAVIAVAAKRGAAEAGGATSA